jgi:hypothetical protein
MPLFAATGSFDDALRKLEPEERFHQACIIKGVYTVRRDARMRNDDRMKRSIFSQLGSKAPRRRWDEYGLWG